MFLVHPSLPRKLQNRFAPLSAQLTAFLGTVFSLSCVLQKISREHLGDPDGNPLSEEGL